MVTRILAVLSASAVVIAALAPAAFAQVSIGGDVQYVDCSQVQNAVGNQGQYANANAGTGGTATAEVAAELNITQEQVNECLGGGGDGGGGSAGGEKPEDPNGDRETTVVKGKTIILDDVATAQLPKTGGASFSGVVLAAGCALLGAGLLVNRVLR